MPTYCDSDDVYRVGGFTSTEVSVADVNKFIDEAENFIESTTNKYFGTSKDIIEYADGSRNDYQTSRFSDTMASAAGDYNWNEGAILVAQEPYHKDNIVLDMYPVQRIDRVYFLINSVSSFGSVLSDNGGVFTDNTTDANSPTTSTFNAFAAVPTTGDAIYFGLSNRFEKLNITLGNTPADTNIAVVTEYYDGATWSTLTVTESFTGVEKLLANGQLEWSAPGNWEQTTVNSSDSLYFIRIRITSGAYATQPAIEEVYAADEISKWVNSRAVRISEIGKLTFISSTIPNGTKNVKVRYNVGAATVPYNVRDLTANMAALQCLVRLIGGSFDDVTAYTIPEMSVSKGEPYTNMRAAIIEIQKRIWGSQPGDRGKYQIGLIDIVGREIKWQVT